LTKAVFYSALLSYYNALIWNPLFLIDYNKKRQKRYLINYSVSVLDGADVIYRIKIILIFQKPI